MLLEKHIDLSKEVCILLTNDLRVYGFLLEGTLEGVYIRTQAKTRFIMYRYIVLIEGATQE